MLSKSICQKCYENHGKQWDEALWCDEAIKHFVVCPAIVAVKNFGNIVGRLVKSSNPPPDYCPYHLEHILEE